jgi:hypothetical protein
VTGVRRDPRTGARYLFAAALLGALLSQPGHLAAYLGHFGRRGLAIESQGVHGYFPSLLGSSLVLLGMVVLGALVVLAAGRLLRGRPRARGVPIGALLLVLLLVQLNVYAVQEMLELTAGGQPLTVSALGGIAGWGLVGQLPLALTAALALSLLSSPVLTALAVLRSPFTLARRLLPEPALATTPIAWPHRLAPVRLEATYPPAFRKRGPPANLRFAGS